MAERAGSVRVIAGQWRGRRLRFPAVAGLRPTSDRRRETLFNWLGADLGGRHCLDLCAGSGALGFEAASRGAARVVLVECARPAVRALERNRTELGADRAEIVARRVERMLAEPPTSAFDLVFLDPPFARPRLAVAAVRALTGAWLAPGAQIYIESAPEQSEALPIPADWQLHRALRGGDACALLYCRGG